MAFTIQDKSEATHPNLTKLYQTDLDILVAGLAGQGVKSGCAVTAQGTPDMTVAVASGTVVIAGAEVAVAAGNVTVTTAHATNPRIDLVVVNNSGTKSVTAGTAAATPLPPDIPSTSVVLAFVYVPANDTAIETAQIADKRVILTATNLTVTTKTKRIPTTLYSNTLGANGSWDVQNSDLISGVGNFVDYDDLEVVVFGRGSVSAASDVVYLLFGTGGGALDTTNANYRSVQHVSDGLNSVGNANDLPIAGVIPAATATADYVGEIRIHIRKPGASHQKVVYIANVERNGAAAQTLRHFSLHWENAGTITRIGIRTDNHATDLIASGASIQIIGYKDESVVTNIQTTGLLTPGYDGWVDAGETWTYGSADDPTYTFTISGDLTGKYSLGMKVRFSQSTGGTKYGFITKIAESGGTTTVTLYMGTDYNLENEVISSPYYSVVKAPFGFPLDPAKWTVAVTDTTQRIQTSPVSGTWYNLGSVSISIPIGIWDVEYHVKLYGTKATNSLDVLVSLSTSNNSESDGTMSVREDATTTTNLAAGVVYRRRTITLTSKTSYYLITKTGTASMINIYNLNDQMALILRAKCVYL